LANKAAPNPTVLAWLDEQAAETLYVTAISHAELLVGIEMLPAGKRRRLLPASLTELLEHLFGSRILPFDGAAAAQYARIYSRTKRTGPISRADVQIAAIAAVDDFSVATRDVEPFRAAGVGVINPWDS